MGAQMDGFTYRYMNGWMDGRLDGCTDRRTNGWTKISWADGQTDRCVWLDHLQLMKNTFISSLPSCSQITEQLFTFLPSTGRAAGLKQRGFSSVSVPVLIRAELLSLSDAHNLQLRTGRRFEDRPTEPSSKEPSEAG